MKYRNVQLVNAWSRGEVAQNHNGSFRATDNGSLFSYNLLIGRRLKSGTVVVADYTAATGNSQSQTTSTHVNIAKRVADLIMHPTVFKASPVSKDFSNG